MSASLVYRLPSVGAFQSPRRRPTLSSVSFPLPSPSSSRSTHTSRSSVFCSKIDVLSTKNKLQDRTGKHPDALESLSPQVRKRLETLRELESQRDELQAKFFEERAAFEAKYQKLYTKRYYIVNGVVEDEKGVPDFHIVNGVVEVEKGVPDFWLTALKNNKVTAETISERDEGALKFLKDIKWFRIENPNGFKLEFFFDTNPYFKNSVLTKIYHIFGEHEPTLENAIGMEIEWHAGKCLTQKILKKKPKKGSKNAKPITKTEQCESFFNFFSPPDNEWLLEEDYNIGVTIREEIIPYAVSWFTGEAAEDEFDDMEDDKGDSLDEDKEDEDEGEEEEDDDEDEEEEDDD